MMTGTLVAFPDGDFFDEALVSLQHIAQSFVEKASGGRIRLPQVHALNCLKDVFTNTRLGPSTEKHLEQTLQIAVGCLNHQM